MTFYTLFLKRNVWRRSCFHLKDARDRESIDIYQSIHIHVVVFFLVTFFSLISLLKSINFLHFTSKFQPPTVLPLRVQPWAGLLSWKILKQRGRLDKRKAGWILDCQLFPAFVHLLYPYNRQPRDSWTP